MNWSESLVTIENVRFQPNLTTICLLKRWASDFPQLIMFTSFSACKMAS